MVTDVRGVIDVEYIAPVGSSDNLSLACKIQLDFPIPGFTRTRQVKVLITLFAKIFIMLLALLIH